MVECLHGDQKCADVRSSLCELDLRAFLIVAERFRLNIHLSSSLGRLFDITADGSPVP